MTSISDSCLLLGAIFGIVITYCVPIDENEDKLVKKSDDDIGSRETKKREGLLFGETTVLENVVNTIGHLWKRKIIKIELTQDDASQVSLGMTKTQQTDDKQKLKFHDQIVSKDLLNVGDQTSNYVNVSTSPIRRGSNFYRGTNDNSGDCKLRRQSTLLEPKNSKSDQKILLSITADSSFTRKIKDSLDSLLLKKTDKYRCLIISGEKFSSPLMKIFNNVKFSLMRSKRKNRCS